ncbi:MAG TPA: polysaccharide biosynthesis C-terminal domain-containing protein [Jatrophihabitans sp.]|nr:polysaccharide biosynthesis C-terminal domain-containing protein [Jatrophihabitans sp.]
MTGVLGRRTAVSNLVAQGTALGVVSLASLIVARTGGAAVLGEYTLLRVLPWLVGVVTSAGLPIASSYFLGARGGDRALRPTLAALAAASGVLTVGVWMALVPVLHVVLLDRVPSALLVVIGITGVTQLWTVWAKACCQGAADIRGANLIIVCEELMFLPAYGAALAVGLRDIEAVVAGMVGGGIAATLIAFGWLVRTGFLRGWSRPEVPLARSVLGYGARGQLGNLLWLVNLRLDFLILGALAGPATLGVYAVASKFAELMRLPATALNYVLYPRFTRQEPLSAWLDARRLLKRACVFTIAGAPVLAALSVVALPLLFGSRFDSAVLPACLLLVGLSVEGAAAVGSAYLWGSGRPGANSVAMGVGVVLTVVFDLLLIPSHGAPGAAVASSIAYLGTAGLLTVLTVRGGRRLDAASTSAISHGAPA